MEEIFIELLQVIVGNRKELSIIPSADDWEALYAIAMKQAMLGVCFYGVKQLPVEQQPQGHRLRQWTGKTLRQQEKNKKVNQECAIVTELFVRGHYNTCVLKGQGNTCFYPEPLRMLRTPGDIDLWVVSQMNSDRAEDGSDVDRKRLVRGLWKLSHGRTDVALHHAELNIFPKTPVEVHFQPSFAVNPFMDRRFRHWFYAHRDCRVMTADRYYRPTRMFNLVFQLSHIYRHLLLEGVGFRQLMDYYFLLVPSDSGSSADSLLLHEEREAVMRDIRYLGMSRVAGALMWIMREVFAIKDEYMLCEPQEKYGREMLEEVLAGGNFGHSFDKSEDGKPETMTKGRLQDNIRSWKRGLRLFFSYPSEAIWVPWLSVRGSFARNYWRRVSTNADDVSVKRTGSHQ